MSRNEKSAKNRVVSAVSARLPSCPRKILQRFPPSAGSKCGCVAQRIRKPDHQWPRSGPEATPRNRCQKCKIECKNARRRTLQKNARSCCGGSSPSIVRNARPRGVRTRLRGLECLGIGSPNCPPKLCEKLLVHTHASSSRKRRNRSPAMTGRRTANLPQRE